MVDNHFFKKLNRSWFFSNPHPLLRLITVYVKGDALVLIPTALLIGSIGIFSIRFMLIMIGMFLAIRGLGEMIYWLLQQFGEKTYRPSDFGLEDLDNESIYIVYQLIATATATAGMGLAVWSALYLY